MASNVFGEPITGSTRADGARMAFDMKNADGKDANALRYVEDLKEKWGDGVSTLCLVYNATGGDVTLVTSYDWHGHIGSAPYPASIANGQWGAFLHVKTSGTATGSSAAVVYRGKNAAGKDCDWMLAWSNPWDRNLYDNTVYTEIREPDQFSGSWKTVSDILYGSGRALTNRWNGCESSVSTGSDYSPIFEAILKLDDVPVSVIA